MKKMLLAFAVALCTGTASAQTIRNLGIGTASPDTTAILDIVSTSKGILLPRMTTDQRDAIVAPANALLIYNTDQQCYNFYDSVANQWQGMGCTGNAGIGIADPDCGTAVISGASFQVGKVVTNVLTIDVNVTQAGPWSYSQSVNGITFSGSGIFADTGTLTLTLTAAGTPQTAGTSFATISINKGAACPVGFTTTYGPSSGTVNCTNALINGTYTAGTVLNAANTITLPVNIASPGTYSITTNTVNGYSFSASGTFVSTGLQNVILAGTATPTAAGTNSFTITYGASTCSKSVTVGSGAATVATITCGGSVVTGTLTQGIPASSVTVSVPYTGGNGGSYSAISINSTTVTGLTATAAAGNVANGNGNLVLTISGTPAGNGTASFALSLGGQSCSFTVPVASPTPPAPTLSFCTGTGELNHAQRVGTYTIGGNSVTVTSTTTGSISTNSYTTCGLTTKSGGTEMANNSTLTLNFSRPVSNIQIRVGDLDINETLTVTTSNGNPTITKFGGTCPGNFIVTGNTMTGNIGGAGYTNGASSNLNFGGIYFTTLTLSYAGGTGLIGVSYCYGNAASR